MRKFRLNSRASFAHDKCSGGSGRGTCRLHIAEMLALAILCFSLCSALRLSYNSQDTYYFSPFMPEQGVQQFLINAPAYGVINIFDQEHESGQARGKIGVLLSDDVSGKFREDYVFRAMDLGMVGLVAWTSWVPDHFADFYDPKSLSKISIPYVSIALDNRDKIHEVVMTGNATITLNSADSVNPWPIAYTSWWYIVIWRGILGAYAIGLTIFAFVALIRWFMYWRQAKTYSKIAVLCLVVELLCCAERAGLHIIGGLLGCRFLPFPAVRFMYSATLPLNFLTTALTAAYLHEVLTTKSPLGTMVQKTKGPLMVLSIFYLILDWPANGLSSFNLFLGAGTLATISSGLLTAATGITAILLLYITVRLGAYYRKKTPRVKGERLSVGRASVGGKEEKEKAPPDRLKELVSRVQISTFWLLWTTAGLAFTLLPQFHEPDGFFVINIWIYIGLNTTSLMHILAYGKTPKVQNRAQSVSMAPDSNPTRKTKTPNLNVVVPVDASSTSKNDSVPGSPDKQERSTVTVPLSSQSPSEADDDPDVSNIDDELEG